VRILGGDFFLWGLGRLTDEREIAGMIKVSVRDSGHLIGMGLLALVNGLYIALLT
jgi:hypothetical protein